MSELFEHVVSALGSVHRLTTAYHPQTNATERVNRTLKTAIRAYVGDKHTSWDKFLPQICFALRTAPHDSTGMTPAMMLYGRELDTPLDLITQPSTAGVDEPGVPYPETLRASLQEAHDQTKAALDYSHDRQKHYYDLRHRHAMFRVGDLVRVKTHPRSDAQSNFTAKLAPLFEGPLCVSQRLSDVNYRLTWVDSGVDAGVYHVVNMQPFHTWDSLTSKEHSVSSPAGRETAEDLNSDSQACPGPPADTDIDSEPFAFDLPDVDSSSGVDGVPDSVSPRSVQHPAAGGHYNLRPRRCPRITSGWSNKRWTNDFHTTRLDLK